MATFVLRPRPPRLLALAAVVLFAAAVLFGVGLASNRLGFWLVAGLLAVLDLALIAVSLVAWRRRRIRVELDAHGYAIVGPDGERTGAWGDVTRVALSRQRDKLAFYHGEQRRTVIAHPAGVGDDEFLRLRHAVDRYLDTPGS